MLSRSSSMLASAIGRCAPLSSRITAVSASRAFGTYSNQNAPETKSNVKQQVSDAKSGKSAERVADQKSTSGKMAGESGASQGATKKPASSTSATSENAINQPNARPDDIRHDNDYNDKTTHPKTSK